MKIVVQYSDADKRAKIKREEINNHSTFTRTLAHISKLLLVITFHKRMLQAEVWNVFWTRINLKDQEPQLLYEFH